MLNTIALISPFGTRQVALEFALPVPQGSPQHGLYPNENTTAEESRNAVPKGVDNETTMCTEHHLSGPGRGQLVRRGQLVA
jgi:hypothetical protein